MLGMCDYTEQDRGYIAIGDHGLIGNLRTAALVSTDGSIESYCVPYFDSPSVFARILDKDKGGHFSITPTVKFSVKQGYLPSSNVNGVVSVTDFLPRNGTTASHVPLLHWLVRRVEVIRGRMPIRMECAPAFNYARDKHATTIESDDSVPATDPQRSAHNKATFASANLTLDLRYVSDSTIENVDPPAGKLEMFDLSSKGHKGRAVSMDLDLVEGQVITFVLRTPPDTAGSPVLRPTEQRAKELGIPFDKLVLGASTMRDSEDPILTTHLLNDLFSETNNYWNAWIRGSTYKGSWKEAVHRSALALKLLIFEPTGAVVASPTFSLPEYIGGTPSWIRDSSFTLYALIRLGFTDEANAYMEFIFDRLKDKNPDGSLQIMYTIHGGRIFPEEELNHLDGHKGSRPDIYGELMDCIYLGQKFGRPLSYDTWEVRNKMWHFTLFMRRRVAIDRGLRLADKRSLPCPNRMRWYAARDDLYEQIMQRAWNPAKQIFGQSYESNDVLDSAVLIMPLVFFSTATDSRFISTLKAILKTPERGGLTANNLVYRYNTQESDDGVGGEEGTFCLCTLWCVEALTRAGQYDKALLNHAIRMFEDFLQYTNHLGLCSEEIMPSGDALGNAVQGFTHVTLISAAFNLSRTLHSA
ncbi:glycoside hydrolase family 15 protein [Vararia minispora EC-137]|uniref:Glycoside hydrolase family 15 protein n=1 Tax=Vararia minispora EC-137 TaxID=1314806 RepID=A0ACB8QTN3_9AGAM|nr:glycoside hydrolase family 15 protein [Vararia minispora EC-137]